jgi:hypothetical protein
MCLTGCLCSSSDYFRLGRCFLEEGGDVQLIGFLVLFPLLAAALLLVIRQEKARVVLVVCASVLIMAASVTLAATYLFAPAVYFSLNIIHTNLF